MFNFGWESLGLALALGLVMGTWTSGEYPTSPLRRHTETITTNRHEYHLTLGGTMDGFNTRDPIGYQAWIQRFEPNVAVRLENVGEVPVVNPWLVVNGKRHWRTVEDILAEVLGPEMSEGEKARALWEFQRRHRFHATTNDAEVRDPVKMLNVYGYTLCGDDAQVLCDLWRAAGLKVRRGWPTGHSTTEVWYEGRWHLLDGDENIICLLRDNETIASEEDIVRDHDLMKRTHTYGILTPDDRFRDEFSASLHTHEGERQGEWRSHIGHRMYFTLRPGEALVWRWDNVGRYHGRNLPTGRGPRETQPFSNGRWLYHPDLRRESYRFGVSGEKNLQQEADPTKPALHPRRAGEPAQVTFVLASPYVFVGGRLQATFRRAQAADECRLLLSFDGQKWQKLWAAEQTGRFEASIDLNPQFPPEGPPRYRYWVRFAFRATREPTDLGLEEVAFTNLLQMAPLSLPALELGDNTILYTDETAAPHVVRVTHEWVECSASRPPAPPPRPLFPAAGAAVEGTKFTFAWEPPEDPDGDAIADYHFQLSRWPDCRWVLSPNFDKLISRTATKGQAKYEIPYRGLLNPGQTYYWRVRARDAAGVWGPWSAIWRFTPQGPGVPLNVQVEVNRAARTVTLKWEPNPQGRPPVRYKVYGSNEKGFTVSDEPYLVNVGNQGEKQRETFPANLVGETTGTEMVVVGPGAPPRGNKAFYRVVAVDAQGVESGPSDYATATRPFVYTAPVTAARTGETYRYQIKTLFSLGDLRCRRIGGNPYNAAFWDREQPRFSLLEGPAWLTLNEATGVLTGVPPAGDESPRRVTVQVTIEGLGADTQTFLLHVEPGG